MHIQINQSQLQIAKALACAHARTHRLPEHARADSAHTRTPNKGGFGLHLASNIAVTAAITTGRKARGPDDFITADQISIQG